MKFSDAAMKEIMEAAGFHYFAKDEAISAKFSSITVFEVKGAIIESDIVKFSSGISAGVPYRLAISTSLNKGCITLLNDIFIDNEDDWKIENKCKGPFILVEVGPTSEHRCSSGYMKNEMDGSITTYDSFPNFRVELDQIESRALPPIISALTCVLNENDQYIELQQIARISLGRMSCDTIVRDMPRAEISAKVNALSKIDDSHLSEKLDLAADLALQLNPNVSRFFALGLSEKDQLKRFLYFFLALEIETHAVFGRTDHSMAVTRIIDPAAAHSKSIEKLLKKQIDTLKSLHDRFVWCAVHAWPNLTEVDIENFKKLKDARDAIAHGRASEPPPGFAHLAKLLAHKVIWSKK